MKKLSSNWVNTATAARELGISQDHLFHLKNDGTFKLKIHYRDIRGRNAMRATYRWHLPNCQKALDIAPEFR